MQILYFASDELKSDREVVLAAIKHEPRSLVSRQQNLKQIVNLYFKQLGNVVQLLSLLKMHYVRIKILCYQ